MAAILIVIDGVTDTPQPCLGGRTPLEAADCPTLWAMARSGMTGSFSNVPKGYPVDSLTCILTLLGYPAQAIPQGRAALEALAAGVPVGEEDVVLRCNLVTFDGQGKLISPCGAGLTLPEQGELCSRLAQKLTTASSQLFPMGGYKNLLVLRGHRKNLPGLVTYPPHERLGDSFGSLLPKGNLLSAELGALIQNSITPAEGSGFHGLIPWGQAVCTTLPAFQSLHGCDGAMVCATEIVRGIGLDAQMETPKIAGATADVDTDLSAKADAAIRLARQFPVVVVHLNGADEAAHRRNPREKAEFLSRIDRELIAPLAGAVPEGSRVLVTSDHATLCETGEHRDLPQPFVLWEKGRSMGEKLGSCRGGTAVELLLCQEEKGRKQ